MRAALSILVFAVALIAVPIAVPAAGVALEPMTSTLLIAFGAFLFVGGLGITAFTRFWIRTRADEAFVKTGQGGLRVVKDGGAFVIPVLHDVVAVPLRTFRLEVKRNGPDALLTEDKLRADIRAEFFVRVLPDNDDIINAARSLGDRTAHDETIKALIEDKLVSALRTVAATRTLEDLNSKRDEFVRQVMDFVTHDLKHNGFTLETATISALDQADAASLRDDNVFDAEGKLTISRVTEEKRTERNRIERERERERLAQDVENRRKMLDLQRQQAEAEAQQQAAVKVAQAERLRETNEKEIEARRLVEVAQLKREEAVEVATRDKLRGVAQAETEQAKAERQRAVAEAEAEQARQRIETVRVEELAERQKKQEVISAQAEAEKGFVTAQRKADADAYRVQKEADARKAAADAEAEAIRKRAEAESDAAVRRAQGAEAEAMVPVKVEQEKVQVKQREADVEIKLLEQRERFGKAGIELQLRLAEIRATSEVGVEAARAMGQALSAADMQFFGSPEMLGQVVASFMRGQSVAQTANGFTSTAAPEVRALAERLLHGGAGVLEGLAVRLGVPADRVSAAVRALAAPAADGKDDATEDREAAPEAA